MWLSTQWDSEGLDDAASQSCEEEGDEWCLRSQAWDHSRGFCLGLVSEDGAGLLPVSPCSAGSILPWQVGHWSTCCAMGALQPSKKRVKYFHPALPGRDWALSCTHGHGACGAATFSRLTVGRGKGEHHHTSLWRT